ncbi:ABC transporter permease [Spiroplasma alleghenense]|uniref:Uncharacterized protein n=1 Tax=Spiroplasma alleghenense TaxID=216931 RepID=A0A345Z542_9MOLU|nr:ABC transporter permease [Spiroplasma alleghenense]AXK51721.1 hypothetical protein SALLE_v1c10510 [Spiroplasma alleghenense]
MMSQNSRVIFKFSLLRIIKNKLFIILTAIILSLIVLIPILAMTLGENIINDVEMAMIFIIVLSIFWISFVNINNIVTIAITDEKSGIQSLENRRGVKNSSIFFAKFAPLKIITLSYILLVYLIFILVSLMFPIPLKGFIIRNLAVGIFSLIAYDFLIFGVVLLLSSTTRSMKKALPFGWILMTLFMFFSIFGPIFFAFNPDLGDWSSNIYEPSIKNNFDLRQTQTSETNFLTQLSESLNDLENSFKENIAGPIDGDFETIFRDHDITKLIFNDGMITYFGELIEQGSFEKSVEKYFKKFNTSLEKTRILINEAELKKALEDNLYYEFVKSINIKAEWNKEKHFKNSYFYKSSGNNYNKPQQLKEVLDNFKNFDNGTVKISENETEVLKSTVVNSYRFEYSLRSNDDVIGKNWTGKIDSKNFFYNYNFWIDSSPYSPGSYLFNKISSRLIKNFKYPLKIEEEKFRWKIAAALNYQINPFMWFYEMVYFSGVNNPETNHFIAENSPLPIAPLTFYNLDKEGNLIYTKRPFAVWANYLGFIAFGTTLATFGYLSFCKTKDERKRLD